MTSKTKPLKCSTTRKDLDYTLYKYSDIQNLWIICQGYLNYRAVQIKLFNISQFAMYYVVLAKIPIEDERETMAIYLYRNQKHKPSNFFQLNEYEKIFDHCSKPIKSSYYLFELIGKDPSDIEIFGANDASDREKWMKHIHQALIWTKQNFIPNESLPIIQQGSRRSWKENPKKIDQIDADVRWNYEPFNERDSSSTVPNSQLALPHRPVLGDKPEETTESIYLTAINFPKSEDTPLEDKPMTWNDIFYPNEPDDHSRILNSISQIGAFLIRPQSKQTNCNDHDYTLSIYAFGGIIKYRILKSSNDKYSLVSNMSEPSFASIADLCQYYTNHHLPRSTIRDDRSNGSGGHFCLKWPYTYYLNNSNSF